MKSLVIVLLAGCTPLLDLEGPCGRNGDRCPAVDGGRTPDSQPPETSEDAGTDPELLDAEAEAGPALAFDAAVPSPPPDAAVGTVPPPDGGPTTCAQACGYLEGCLARPDVCPALSAHDRAALAQLCNRYCDSQVALPDIVAGLACADVPDLLRGLADGLPADCHQDTAPLPMGAQPVVRVSALAPTNGEPCVAVVGRGEGFTRLAQQLDFDFSRLIAPPLGGFPSPTVAVGFEGWTPGETGNAAGQVVVRLYSGTLAALQASLALETALGSLDAWLNGGRLTSQPGAVTLPIPAVPNTAPLQVPLVQAHLEGALNVDFTGVTVTDGHLVGYLNQAGMVELVTQLRARCNTPDPLTLETCFQLQATLDLRGTPDQIAARLWALAPPDAVLGPMGAGRCDEGCNALSVCLAVEFVPAPPLED